MARHLLLLALAAALAAPVACNRNVPSKEEVEGGGQPQAAAPAQSLPTQVNTLPPVGGGKASPHAAIPPAKRLNVSVAAGSIQPAEGGLTVRQVFAQRKELAGKNVVVRGKVVKAMHGVMGTNWYHIQDGTGEPGSNDLAVTSDGMADVGDVVLVAGPLTVDKDLKGMGYHYDAILEKAQLKVEQKASEAEAAAGQEGGAGK
ncbi:MAG: hypothetical protein D6739_00665 [Nitrospirae bacterium]|nr:MAG: hypothetical protein D6739_00665 [Nitrospirota bacterium]